MAISTVSLLDGGFVRPEGDLPLPPEILRIILSFVHAQHIHDSAFRIRMGGFANLSLICQRWYPITQSLLFSWLSARTKDEVDHLRFLFQERFPPEAAYFVRELKVHTFDDHRPWMWNACTKLVACFPRLERLVLRFDSPQDYDSSLPPLPNLKLLSLVPSNGAGDLSVLDLVPSLPSMKRLQRLDLDDIGLVDLVGKPSQLQLKSLSYRPVGSPSRSFLSSALMFLPSVKTLTSLRLGNLQAEDAGAMCTFISLFSTTLKDLSLADVSGPIALSAFSVLKKLTLFSRNPRVDLLEFIPDLYKLSSVKHLSVNGFTISHRVEDQESQLDLACLELMSPYYGPIVDLDYDTCDWLFGSSYPRCLSVGPKDKAGPWLNIFAANLVALNVVAFNSCPFLYPQLDGCRNLKALMTRTIIREWTALPCSLTHLYIMPDISEVDDALLGLMSVISSKRLPNLSEVTFVPCDTTSRPGEESETAHSLMLRKYCRSRGIKYRSRGDKDDWWASWTDQFARPEWEVRLGDRWSA